MPEDTVTQKLVDWAQSREDIRTVILTSTRADPHALLDIYSDYDVILVVRDIDAYLGDGWLADFGDVLTVYRDPVLPFCGHEKFTRVVQYEEGLKIDFTVWPIALLEYIAGLDRLPDYLDDGFLVLLDKDGLAENVPEPTRAVFVIQPPTEEEYRHKVEYFFSNACYLPKQIFRGDLLTTVLTLEYAMKQEDLLPMLEWKVGLESGWTARSGLGGKGLAGRLDTATRAELAATWTGGSPEERWLGLFRLITLFRRIAREVGDSLGYTYPQDMDDRVMAYLQQVKTRDAAH